MDAVTVDTLDAGVGVTDAAAGAADAAVDGEAEGEADGEAGLPASPTA